MALFIYICNRHINMRAKLINEIATVFDFDDTLIKSNAKIYIYRNGKFIKSLTPRDYHHYKKKANDIFDTSDFDDLNIILNAQTYKMWSLLEQLDKTLNVNLFILTGRHQKAKKIIHQFLVSKGIKNLPFKNIYAVGDKKGVIDIPLEKRKVLEVISKQYSIINFYDDSYETINLVKDIPELNAYFVQ